MCLESTYRSPAPSLAVWLRTVAGTGVQVQNVNGGGDWLGAMSAPGSVSRVTPVHTAVRTRRDGTVRPAKNSSPSGAIIRPAR
jgi:hypothetical protein